MLACVSRARDADGWLVIDCRLVSVPQRDPTRREHAVQRCRIGVLGVLTDTDRHGHIRFRDLTIVTMPCLDQKRLDVLRLARYSD